jgi:predicted AAA+ superfamily ATPase
VSESFPVVLVTGARQVGKTTLMKELASREGIDRGYVSLDEFGPRSMAQDDPALFWQRYPAPVVVDEIQHAPGLLEHLKPIVDRSEWRGGFWLTGSQSFPLMKEVSESLAGRVGIVTLMGLSAAEAAEREAVASPFRPDRLTDLATNAATDLLAVFRAITRGGFPRLAHPDAPPLETFHDSYLQTYIERDVRALLNVSDIAAFRRFLRVLAARTGQLLNVSDAARDVGIAVSTAREWLHLLEATHQAFLLRPYFENIGKRQIKTPKMYFVDTGLACHLTGWRTAEAASAGAMAGPLLETFVVSELLKSYRHRGREAPIWFFRDREKNEVDVVIAEDGLLFPVEVKLSATPDRSALSGVRAIGRTGAKLGRGVVVCMTARPFSLSEDVDAVPVSAVL